MKIYLAAFEHNLKIEQVASLIDANVFLTFWKRNDTDKTMAWLKELGHQKLITVDSGAHTFFEKNKMLLDNEMILKKGSRAMLEIQAYYEKYREWVLKNYENFSYFVELDLQDLVGREIVAGWRENWQKDGVADKLITVLHKCDSKKDWFEMLEKTRSRYVGIPWSGKRYDRLKVGVLELLKTAWQAGVRVHGFAGTSSKDMKKYPFYSVNSSSWKNAPRFGQVMFFDNGAIKSRHPRDKGLFQRYNIPVKKMHHMERSSEVTREKFVFCGREYLKMEDYLFKYWKTRGIDWEKRMEEFSL